MSYHISKSNNQEIDLGEYFNKENNLIDYFVEVGIKPSEVLTLPSFFKTKDELNKFLKPKLISKFPDREKLHLHIDDLFADFVFPNGMEIKENEKCPQPESFYLIMDNKFYSSVYTLKYISCLIIYENVGQYRKLYNEYNKINTEPIEKENLLYIPKCLCIVSVFPYFEYYKNTLENLYLKIYKDKLYEKNSNILFDKIICHLTTEVPYLPRGKSHIFLNLFEKEKKLEEKKLNDLPLINCDLKKTLDLFQLEDFIEIYLNILYETRTIFFSKTPSLLSEVIYSFISILYPFNYYYQVISILPKIYYSYLDNKYPFIFGINESYSENFGNLISKSLGNLDYVLVDLDEKKVKPYINQKNKIILPNHYKIKLEKLSKFKKARTVDKKDMQEMQILYFNFMISLFRNYINYINLDKANKEKEIKDINDAIESYLATESFREFFQKVFETKMIKNYLKKRVSPLRIEDYIDNLFFEEKIAEREEDKKFIKLSKKKGGEFLSNKMFDFNLEQKIVINKDNCKIVDEEKEYFTKEENKKEFLSRGILTFTSKNEVSFEYIIFPQTTNSELFMNNITTNNNINLPKNLYINIYDNYKSAYEEVLKIEEENIREKDLYLSWIILWGMTIHYTEKRERNYRFKLLKEIISKIKYFDDERILTNLIKFLYLSKEYKMILILYKILIERNVQLNSDVYNTIKKILISNKSDNNEESFFTLLGQNKLEDILQDKETDFNIRTLKNKSDKNIISDQVVFNAVYTCDSCQKKYNLYKKIEDLLKDPKSDYKCLCLKEKCPQVDLLGKLYFRLGIELFDTIDDNSCLNDSVIVYIPELIKDELMTLSQECLEKNIDFDVENFRSKNKVLFWNIIWYFKIINVDISFMLPYAESIKVHSDSINDFISFCSISEEPETTNLSISTNESTDKKCHIIQRYQGYELIDQNAYQIEIVPHVGMIKNDKFLKNNEDTQLNKNISMTSFKLSQTTNEQFINDMNNKKNYEENNNKNRNIMLLRPHDSPSKENKALLRSLLPGSNNNTSTNKPNTSGEKIKEEEKLESNENATEDVFKFDQDDANMFGDEA